MSKLTILVGISGAGKSTLSRKLVEEMPKTIIINRDSLRAGLTGKSAAEYNRNPNPFIESIVTSLTYQLLGCEIYNDGSYFNNEVFRNVIVDATHLKQKYINELKKRWVGEIELILVDCSLDLAKKRVQQRDGYVKFVDGYEYVKYDGYENVKYIDSQYQQLQELKKHIIFDKIINTDNL